MDTPQLPHERLDQYIRERAKELGIARLRDIADAIDVSEPTLIGWRNGTQFPTVRYAQRLDRWMGWREAPSSTIAVLEGGKPVKARKKKPESRELPVSGEDDDVASVIAEIEADPNLKQEQKDLLIGHLRATAQYTRAQARQLSQQAAERDRAS